MTKQELLDEIHADLSTLNVSIYVKIDHYRKLCMDEYNEHPDVATIMEDVINLLDLLEIEKRKTADMLKGIE